MRRRCACRWNEMGGIIDLCGAHSKAMCRYIDPEPKMGCEHKCHTDPSYANPKFFKWPWKVCPLGCGISLAGKEDHELE